MNDIQAKLLDAWSPPNGAGDPVGLIATTYTFDGMFFEEECLGRFLNIQSNVNSDGPFYLIELEEKLSGLECVSVLVDSSHCSGSRNLRWDLIPARVKKGGVFHPKITILHWAHMIRLIIGSANISENGYRENQETFSFIDFSPVPDGSMHILLEVLGFLSDAINEVVGYQERPDTGRYRDFILRLENTVESWGGTENEAGIDDFFNHTVFVKPSGVSLFERLQTIWRDNCRGVPNEAIVTSPFFNPPEDKANLPAQKIWDVLSQRGSVKVIYNTPVDNFSTTEDTTLICAPSTLLTLAPKNRRNADVEFRMVQNLVRKDDKENIRPFHFKSICIKNHESIVYLIGSSNFTTAGTGLRTNSNYEANLVFSVRNNKDHYKALENSRIKGSKIPGKYEFLTTSGINDDESGSEDYLPLPQFFESLMFVNDRDNKLVLTFSSGSPALFEILSIDGEVLYNEKAWIKNGKPLSISIPWGDKPLPSGLKVCWKESGGFAYWPVIVKDKSSLPPPADLKNLPLEILIKIITSSRPMHQIVGEWLMKKDKSAGTDRFEMNDIIDPHKRVDTSAYLLQRTRKMSNALFGLRQRLERPVFTLESLTWRLYGPIGVIAVSKAVIQDATTTDMDRSDEEIAFILTEIALELSRIKYIEVSNSLSEDKVSKEIQQVVRELHGWTRPYTKKLSPEMRDYIKKAFKSAAR